MVHKRYIKRGGKIHGPYYYESYREDGKVKKRYIGTSLNIKKRNIRKVVLHLTIVFFALVLIFSFFYLEAQNKTMSEEVRRATGFLRGIIGGAVDGANNESNDSLIVQNEVDTSVNITKGNKSAFLSNETKFNNTFGNETILNNTINSTFENSFSVNATMGNESNMMENKSILEEVNQTKLKLIKDLSSIRIGLNGTGKINISEYFSGAENYSLDALNIRFSFGGEVVTLIPDEGFKGARQAKIIAYAGNESLESNQFTILVSSMNVNIQTSKVGQIKVGEPVKWVKNVSLEAADNVSIELPKEAENVSVSKIEKGEAKEAEVTIQRVSLSGNAVKIYPKEFSFAELLRSFLRFIGFAVDEGVSGEDGRAVEVVLQDNATEYIIEYETPAPEAFEEATSDGKKIIISGPDNLNYTDVLAYTTISEVLKVGQENVIVVKWVENGTLIPFDAYDLDGNGYLDYVEWSVPHLSNQTFEIILISDAQELDENKTFIRNVYEQVRARDGNWSGEIEAGRYVRVKFERNLTSSNDITIYARSNGTNASIGVYEKGENNEIANFGLINEDKKYKIFLTNLSGIKDTFDLLVQNGAIDFDFIIDPIFNDTFLINNGTSVTLGAISTPAVNLKAQSWNRTFAYVDDFGVLSSSEDIGTDVPVYLNDLDFGTSNFTISMWFNASVLTGTQVLFSKNYALSNPVVGYRLELHDNKLNVSLADGTNTLNNATLINNLVTNRWYNLVAVFARPAKITLYLDGVQIQNFSSAQPTGSISNDYNTFIGASGTVDVNGYYIDALNGTVDEVRVYNTTLTISDVLLINQSGFGQNFSVLNNANDSNLVLYLPFNENSGTTAHSIERYTKRNFTLGGRWYSDKVAVTLPSTSYIQSGNNFTLTDINYAWSELNISYTEQSAVAGANLIYRCGIINASGIYYLNQSFSAAGTCIDIQVDNVQINGTGFTITGNGAGVAINASNSTFTNTSTNGAFIRSNITIRDITLTNFKESIISSGPLCTGCASAPSNFNFRGGNLTIINSVMGNVSAVGGSRNLGSNNGAGQGGEILIINSTLDTVLANSGNASDSNGPASLGGKVTIINSSVNIVSAVGYKCAGGSGCASSPVGGGGGDILLINSVLKTYANASGSGNDYGGYIYVENSSVNGSKLYAYSGGFSAAPGGIINITGRNVNLSNALIDVGGGRATRWGKLVINYTNSFEDAYTFYPADNFTLSIFSNNGEVIWGNITRNSVNNLSRLINITNNFAEVNVSSLPGLNTTANITLYNIATNLQNPIILYNNIMTCTSSSKPACTNLTMLNAGTVSFNVSSWSNYSIVQFDHANPQVYLISPANGSSTTTALIYFSANFSDNVNLTNATFYLMNSTNSSIATNFTALTGTGTANSTTLSVNLPSAGIYYWNYLAYDNSSNKAFNLTNWSVAYTISESPGGSTGGEGGGSGGRKGATGGNRSSCVEGYNCAEWSECVGERQSRECINSTIINGICEEQSSTEMRACEICAPDVSCSWSSCSSNISIGNCVDAKGCAGDYSLNVSCAVEGCKPKYNCREWGACEYGQNAGDVLAGDIKYLGVKSRECKDISGCSVGYTDKQSCSSDFEIKTNKEEICGGEYLVSSSIESEKPVSTINIESWKADKLDVGFVQNDVLFCSTCYNGIRDADEIGVDCGGSCKECASDRTNFIDYAKNKVYNLIDNEIIRNYIWLILLIILLIIYFIWLWLFFLYKRRKEKEEEKKKHHRKKFHKIKYK